MLGALPEQHRQADAGGLGEGEQRKLQWLDQAARRIRTFLEHEERTGAGGEPVKSNVTDNESGNIKGRTDLFFQPLQQVFLLKRHGSCQLLMQSRCLLIHGHYVISKTLKGTDVILSSQIKIGEILVPADSSGITCYPVSTSIVGNDNSGLTNIHGSIGNQQKTFAVMDWNQLRTKLNLIDTTTQNNYNSPYAKARFWVLIQSF
jgi:hypothetical protein